MTERSRALSNAAYSSVGVYTEYLFGLIASILIARALGPADLGIYSLLIWMVSTAVVVSNAGITTAAIKFVAELHGSGNAALIGALVRRLRRLQRIMLLVTAALLALVFAAAHQRLAPGVRDWELVLVVASLCLRAPYMFNIALAKGGQDFRSTAIIACLSAAVNLGMIGVAFAWHAPLPAFIVIYAASSAVFFAISTWRASSMLGTANRSDLPLTPQLQARVSHHLRVVAVTIVLSSVGSGEIELPFLSLLAGHDDAGMFKVANALAMGAASLVPGVLNAQLLPLMANAYGRSREEAASLIAGVTAWLFVLGAPLVAVGAVFSRELVAVLYGAAFAPAAQALSVLMVARVAGMLGQGAAAYLVSADRQLALMKLTLLFTAMRVAGAFAATFYFGLAGAVVSSAVLAMLGSSATIRLALRETGSRLPWARLARIALAAALAGACSMPSAWLEPPLLALAVGMAVFAVVYPLALWVLRCLDAADAEFARLLFARFMGRRVPGILRRRWPGNGR